MASSKSLSLDAEKKNYERRQNYVFGTTMRVNVRYLAGLRQITNKREELLKYPNESMTIGQVLSTLSKRYGNAFDKYVYGTDGRISDHIQVLLGGSSITNLQGLKTRLKDQSQIDIIPLVAGG